jgi:hypothetical protein
MRTLRAVYNTTTEVTVMPDHLISLTSDQVSMLREAIDSHIYWQLSEPIYRRNGDVADPGSDDPDAATEIQAYRSWTSFSPRVTDGRDAAAETGPASFRPDPEPRAAYRDAVRRRGPATAFSRALQAAASSGRPAAAWNDARRSMAARRRGGGVEATSRSPS